MDWTVIIQIIAVQTNIMATLSKTNITVNVQCSSQLEVYCTDDDSSSGLWTFYMQSKNKILQNMAKVFYNESNCHATYLPTIKSSKCVCINGTGVTCHISGDYIVNAGDEWHCSKFSTGSIRESRKVNLGYQYRGECTITSLQEHTTVKGTDHVAGGKTIILTISFTYSNVTEMTATPNVTVDFENYTLQESAYFSSQSHVSNTISTISTPREEPEISNFYSFSNREFIVIFTAAGSAVLIAVCASICTYWKLKTGLRAVNYPVIESDNTTGQHHAIDANILPILLQDSTYVHYHEISEVSTVNINLAFDNQNNEIEDRLDGNPSTPTMETGTINQMINMTEDDPSTSLAGKPQQNYPVPIVFMALAETTFSDVDEPGFGNLRSRTDVESARYEYLDPETRDMKSQYNSLV